MDPFPSCSNCATLDLSRVKLSLDVHHGPKNCSEYSSFTASWPLHSFLCFLKFHVCFNPSRTLVTFLTKIFLTISFRRNILQAILEFCGTGFAFVSMYLFNVQYTFMTTMFYNYPRHYFRITCPILETFVVNTYAPPWTWNTNNKGEIVESDFFARKTI